VTLAPEFESFPDRGVSYLYADLRALPYRDDYFDTVVCISTLDHVGMDNSDYGVEASPAEDPQQETRKALAELERVVAPEGALLVTVPYGRRQDFGWSRQFDRTEVEDLLGSVDAKTVTTSVYRYDISGWQLSDLDGAADAKYHDYKQYPGPTEDMAPAARAVACIRFDF
jgi:SAM-dependent methyltransferase